MLSALNRIDFFISRIEKALLVFFGLALTTIMIAQVILRYFFSSPIFWAEEISVQFLIFITVFGISYITQQKQHISIDFLLSQIKSEKKRIAEIITGILFFILMIGLCFYSWEWVLRADVQMEKSGTTGLPRWYTYAAFPVALSCLCWHQFIVVINRFFNKNKEG
ncbi:TRAP-type C4-dicarboxylate transport system permease small subunit [Paenalcaligenes hominis]|uniref:TRAP transporter small permease protein n=1 Tax=Paenalcaligenes hominis TaxID=643674 RepID=A0ABX0WRB6_9BURK|nr:TRAP transporter small permease [Paenalcaligenes hominis]NJB65302.1 TRAP-type C4-dicarboxylate transport system permease small subunit [Paenalcaligenes hominis]GGE72554.1 C4-dicarboxylate ABC transporter substrate-binding protein [Paenalcaligenes hominis]